jgi:uncharacterized YigZ family protein
MDASKDEFQTIKQQAGATLKVQGSRFIASAYPVQSKEDVENIIAGVRKEHHDATHNCYAYRLGTDGAMFRFNDDGEPNGTAGKPILAAIDKLHLTDTLVVVTRYFGGTKLGIGGLTRAYGSAADAALAAGGIAIKHKVGSVSTNFPHAFIGPVMHIISTTGATIEDTTYDEEIHLRLEIRQSKLEELKRLLVEHTHGNITLK